MRRSLVAKHDLKEGSVIQTKDLMAKRPGYGIPVDQKESMIGKTLLHSIEREALFTWDDVK